MSNTTTPPSPILFLGATGGCTLAALTLTLLSHRPATALVRNPDKLRHLLLETQSVPASLIDRYLYIIPGSTYSLPALTAALTLHQPSHSPLTPLIICGVGGSPRFQASLLQPVTIDQPSLVGDTVANIFTALDQIYLSSSSSSDGSMIRKPSLLLISTTGLTRHPHSPTDAPEDVPFWLRGLYHYILASPHKDKAEAERLLVEDQSPSRNDGKNRLSGYTIVRPSLLTGTAAAVVATRPEETQDQVRHEIDHEYEHGHEKSKIRVGTEAAPAIGSFVPRAEVGRWIFEEVIVGNGSGKKWRGEKVTLTL